MKCTGYMKKAFLSYASEMDDFNVIDKEEDSAKWIWKSAPI